MNWNPSEPLSVRLARVAHPGRPWKPSSMDGYASAIVERDLSGTVMIGFGITSLDSLAQVERRVVEAGMEHALIAAISTVIGAARRGESHSVRVSDIYTATAAQRAAALDALFTAFPDLYERLTGSQ